MVIEQLKSLPKQYKRWQGLHEAGGFWSNLTLVSSVYEYRIETHGCHIILRFHLPTSRVTLGSIGKKGRGLSEGEK